MTRDLPGREEEPSSYTLPFIFKSGGQRGMTGLLELLDLVEPGRLELEWRAVGS